MRPLLLTLPVLCTLIASPALAFEGAVKAKVMNGDQTVMNMEAVYSKAGDVRIDTESTPASGQEMKATTIMPAKGESYYSILHDQKVVVEQSYAALRALGQEVPPPPENPNLEVTKLGKAKVSGHETEHVRVLDKKSNTTIDLWMTGKYPTDLWTRAFKGRNLGLDPGGDQRTAAMKKYGIKPGFALKTVVASPGAPPVTFLIEEVKESKVAKTAFALPEGYKRVKAPAGGAPGATTPSRP